MLDGRKYQQARTVLNYFWIILLVAVAKANIDISTGEITIATTSSTTSITTDTQNLLFLDLADTSKTIKIYKDTLFQTLVSSNKINQHFTVGVRMKIQNRLASQ